MRDTERIYERRQAAYKRLLDKQKRAANRLSNYRLGTFIAGLTITIYLYRTLSSLVGLAAACLAFIIFLFPAFRHQHIRTRLRRAETLVTLNRKGLERLRGAWVEFSDDGEEFKDEDHPFASDLDLIGQTSVFQWISSAHTPLGRKTLAEALKQPLKERAAIAERQEAVIELARRLAWRQAFETAALLAADTQKPAEPLLKWARETQAAYERPPVRFALRLLPIITISMVVLYVAGFGVAWQIPATLMVAQLLLLWVGGRERSRILATVYSHLRSLKAYADMLRQLEKQRFEAPWLIARQERLRDGAGRSAGTQIHKLAEIVEAISSRKNALFFAINVLTLWDFQCMVALEDWKRQSGRRLATWLDVLALVEAASSLANIRFEHPDWAMPIITDTPEMGRLEPLGISAKRMGHPLILRDRVDNDFEMRSPVGICVITGSNMSGKSTFLRTVGVNLVLAYAGAPVCAEQFSCSLMELWSCMRVSDNLGKNISSFYAEILRIKGIVEAAKAGGRVFFLLDEIFKGTNSHDRHQGAKALIGQLQRDGAMGLVSTHDLELGDLEHESSGRIKNYHFREYYEDNQIRFDYRLRRGISTTRNALYLIKMAGIEIDDVK